MTRVEFLWFDDCPSHVTARALLDDVIAAIAPGTVVEAINASDPEVAAVHRFPGSPTIRVDGTDIDPNFVDPGDYTPRCRLFRTAEGLRGVPPREWIVAALASAQSRPGG
jgi:hypothetical protein